MSSATATAAVTGIHAITALPPATESLAAQAVLFEAQQERDDWQQLREVALMQGLPRTQLLAAAAAAAVVGGAADSQSTGLQSTAQQQLLMDSMSGPLQRLNMPNSQQVAQQQPSYDQGPLTMQQSLDNTDSAPGDEMPGVSVPRLVDGAPNALQQQQQQQQRSFAGGQGLGTPATEINTPTGPGGYPAIGGGQLNPTTDPLHQPTQVHRGHTFNASCNILQGGWKYSQHRRSWYNGSSCPYIRPGFNCQLNGRNDTEFLQQYWQPRDCELPQFNPKDFLARYSNKVRGSNRAQVGEK